MICLKLVNLVCFNIINNLKGIQLRIPFLCYNFYGGNMYIEINNNKYEVIVEKKKNKNTYIRVKEDLKIYVSTSYLSSTSYIKKLLYDNNSSIVNMIEREKKKQEKQNMILFLGKKLDLIIVENTKLKDIHNDKLYIDSKSNIDKYFRERAFEIFKERLDYIYTLFDEDINYPILKIRTMKTRWGVCNRKNNSITLNTELIKKDIKYIDYVIIHELCHFIYFDHSKNFWNLVAKYCPNYRVLRKEMKE